MKKYILSLAIMACIMAGCSKIDLDSALDGQTLGTSLATPIGSIDITLSDLYKQFDTIIEPQVADDGTVFVYWESAIKIDEFNIKDFANGQKMEGSLSTIDNPMIAGLAESLPIIPLPECSYTLRDTVPYSFNFDEQSDTSTYYIDSIKIDHAILELEIDVTGLTLDEGTYIEAEISFPTLKSRKPLTFKAIAATSHIKIERSINPFSAEFARSGMNSVDMCLAFKVVSDGTKTVSTNSSINYSVEIKDIDYEAVHGYIYSNKPITSNHTKIDLPDTEQLSEFLEGNKVSLYNPEFSIYLTTNLGVDATLDVRQVYAVNKSGEKKYAEFHGKKSFTKKINTPTTPFDIESDSVTLDRDFGGINKLFEEIPDSIMLDWDIYVGEEGKESGNNFIVNPIIVEPKFSIKVPVWFDKETFIQVGDTIDADLTAINGEWTDIVNIEKFEVYMNFENSLPLHASANIAFLDSLGNELYVAEGIEIPCPTVDELGRSTEAASHEEVFGFPHDAIANIIKTKKIAISILVEGHDKDATINFHANDGLKVKVSAYASVSVTPGNLTNNNKE